MSKGNNEAYVVNADGKEFLYAVGNVTGDFPFLAETEKGTIVTPFYLHDGNEIGMVSGHAVYYPFSKKEEFNIPKVKATLKNLRIPTVALNIPSEKYNRIINYSEAFSTMYKNSKDNGDTTVFVPIVAFDEDAIRLHKEVAKGDTIIVFGELRLTKINAVGKAQMALWVTDVRKDRTAKRNLTGATVD